MKRGAQEMEEFGAGPGIRGAEESHILVILY